jgi:glycosyltransferase involved in cell wall biosynthesis
MGYQDGVDLLLKSIHLLVYKHQLDVYLTLAGGGTELNNLKKIADDLKIGDNVNFYGKIRDDQLLKDLIKSSDICVASDRDSELNNLSTMNKIIEYMALSKPMVLFEAKESRFSAANAAIYVEPDNCEAFADEMSSLLKNQNLMSQLGEFGRARFVRDLCWENQLSSLDAAYWLSEDEN